LLAVPGDAEGIAVAMTRLMRMPIDVREAMGKCARQLVSERYSLEHVLDEWEALYAELLQECLAVPVSKHIYRV
jgi:glycosyltransferase involved in cell wall biosynthesis